MIRQARKDRGMTIQQVAQAVGFDRSYFSLLERGRRRLDDEAVARVALLLGLDPTEALLAGVRERLPEPLRGFIPADLQRDDADLLHAARTHQSQAFDFEIERSRIRATSDWDGNVRFERTLEGCRPNAAQRPVFEITFRERAVGESDDGRAGPGEPSFELLTAARGVPYEHRVVRNGSWTIHRLFFPRGWRRAAQAVSDAFSFRLRSYHPRGLFLSTAQFVEEAEAAGISQEPVGRLNVYVRHFVRQLEVTLDFPEQYRPKGWQSWAQWGQGDPPSAANMAHHACRALRMKTGSSSAKLIADEPLAGYTFSIRWTPLSTQQCLEARYGAIDATQG